MDDKKKIADLAAQLATVNSEAQTYAQDYSREQDRRIILEGDLLRARVELSQLRHAVEYLTKERDAAVSELWHVRATMPVRRP